MPEVMLQALYTVLQKRLYLLLHTGKYKPYQSTATEICITKSKQKLQDFPCFI